MPVADGFTAVAFGFTVVDWFAEPTSELTPDDWLALPLIWFGWLRPGGIAGCARLILGADMLGAVTFGVDCTALGCPAPEMLGTGAPTTADPAELEAPADPEAPDEPPAAGAAMLLHAAKIERAMI